VIVTTLLRGKLLIASLGCQSYLNARISLAWWSNDLAIIELVYCKRPWLVSVLQISYLPLPSTYWVTDQLADRLTDRMTNWPTDWSTDQPSWPTGRLAGCTNWLTDRPTEQLTDYRLSLACFLSHVVLVVLLLLFRRASLTDLQLRMLVKQRSKKMLRNRLG